MLIERYYEWKLSQGTLTCDRRFSSYDLLELGLDSLMMEICVHELTFDIDFRELQLNHTKNSHWFRVDYKWLQSNDHLTTRSFFSEILSNLQIFRDQKMIDEMISYSRAVSKVRGTRSNLFAPVPRMTLDIFYKSFSDYHASQEALMEEESMEVEAFNPVAAANKSSVEALEKLIVDTSCCMDRCMICLEKFHVGLDVITRMPCLHVYHGDCIVHWLETSHFCPVCRFEMPT